MRILSYKHILFAAFCGLLLILAIPQGVAAQATITFATGETSLTMYGYAPSQPNVTATDGTVGAVTYNSTTGIFSYPVSPGPDGTATVTMGLT